ncbi:MULTISPECIES: hypothetical protein [Streptomyces]|uniref:Uncharacterized protein n=1 Tax=Streptomyces lycii TaxID=2654337 RepID=A0ABQ7FDW8_9ACTN|nr:MULTISPECIES: hypothetical protein [Streptomyces]KAF4406855.1 hypothetical protein GCU69_22620 [Streptomyces lycii]PGH48429.1 hypothetical protein CRI70_23130 [Streptomyces sp. Ru87]
MRIQLSLNGARSDVELRSLYRWLRAEGRQLDSAGVTVRAPGAGPGGPHEMGGAFEVVEFVVGTATQLGSLAVAVAAWRAAHHSRSSVTFEHGGTKVTLSGADLDNARAVLSALEELRRNEA